MPILLLIIAAVWLEVHAGDDSTTMSSRSHGVIRFNHNASLVKASDENVASSSLLAKKIYMMKTHGVKFNPPEPTFQHKDGQHKPPIWVEHLPSRSWHKFGIVNLGQSQKVLREFYKGANGGKPYGNRNAVESSTMLASRKSNSKELKAIADKVIKEELNRAKVAKFGKSGGRSYDIIFWTQCTGAHVASIRVLISLTFTVNLTGFVFSFADDMNNFGLSALPVQSPDNLRLEHSNEVTENRVTFPPVIVVSAPVSSSVVYLGTTTTKPEAAPSLDAVLSHGSTAELSNPRVLEYQLSKTRYVDGAVTGHSCPPCTARERESSFLPTTTKLTTLLQSYSSIQSLDPTQLPPTAQNSRVSDELITVPISIPSSITETPKAILPLPSTSSYPKVIEVLPILQPTSAKELYSQESELSSAPSALSALPSVTLKPASSALISSGRNPVEYETATSPSRTPQLQIYSTHTTYPSPIEPQLPKDYSVQSEKLDIEETTGSRNEQSLESYGSIDALPSLQTEYFTEMPSAPIYSSTPPSLSFPPLLKFSPLAPLPVTSSTYPPEPFRIASSQPPPSTYPPTPSQQGPPLPPFTDSLPGLSRPAPPPIEFSTYLPEPFRTVSPQLPSSTHVPGASLQSSLLPLFTGSFPDLSQTVSSLTPSSSPAPGSFQQFPLLPSTRGSLSYLSLPGPPPSSSVLQNLQPPGPFTSTSSPLTKLYPPYPSLIPPSPVGPLAPKEDLHSYSRYSTTEEPTNNETKSVSIADIFWGKTGISSTGHTPLSSATFSTYSRNTNVTLTASLTPSSLYYQKQWETTESSVFLQETSKLDESGYSDLEEDHIGAGAQALPSIPTVYKETMPVQPFNTVENPVLGPEQSAPKAELEQSVPEPSVNQEETLLSQSFTTYRGDKSSTSLSTESTNFVPKIESFTSFEMIDALSSPAITLPSKEILELGGGSQDIRDLPTESFSESVITTNIPKKIPYVPETAPTLPEPTGLGSGKIQVEPSDYENLELDHEGPDTVIDTETHIVQPFKIFPGAKKETYTKNRIPVKTTPLIRVKPSTYNIVYRPVRPIPPQTSPYLTPSQLNFQQPVGPVGPQPHQVFLQTQILRQPNQQQQQYSQEGCCGGKVFNLRGGLCMPVNFSPCSPPSYPQQPLASYAYQSLQPHPPPQPHFQQHYPQPSYGCGRCPRFRNHSSMSSQSLARWLRVLYLSAMRLSLIFSRQMEMFYSDG
uniref:SERPIN domain-containing protein n=1 Tax=Angiostrongylus cantonensis TaxID=6313 RepID=A0A158P893_ANGCA